LAQPGAVKRRLPSVRTGEPELVARPSPGLRSRRRSAATRKRGRYATNDRAFIFDPAHTQRPRARVGDDRAAHRIVEQLCKRLCASATGASRERNSCEAPWTSSAADWRIDFNPKKSGLPQRTMLACRSRIRSPALGPAPSGQNHHAWMGPGRLPDNTLLVVRGFITNPAAKVYHVKSSLGNTSRRCERIFAACRDHSARADRCRAHARTKDPSVAGQWSQDDRTEDDCAELQGRVRLGGAYSIQWRAFLGTRLAEITGRQADRSRR